MVDSEHGTLRNQFLVAMPSLDDDHFSQTVTLICEHNDDGALGLVVNRPTDLRLSDMLTHLGLQTEAVGDDSPQVYWGGPVAQERGFVLHTEGTRWEATLDIGDGLYVTTSRDILDALAEGNGPERYIVLLGYAGWDAGQLESEILHNAWLNVPADRQILFDTPSAERWQAATRLSGVDFTQISTGAGHA